MNILLYVMFVVLSLFGLVSLACAIYTLDSIFFIVTFFLLLSSALIFSEIRKLI